MEEIYNESLKPLDNQTFASIVLLVGSMFQLMVTVNSPVVGYF